MQKPIPAGADLWGSTMTDISATSSAVQGIQRGLQGLNKNAAEIASAKRMDGDGADDTQPMVEMMENRQQVEASAKVLKTVDETLGSLLDVKA